MLGSSPAVAEITTSDMSASEKGTAVDQGNHTCSKPPAPALVRVLLCIFTFVAMQSAVLHGCGSESAM